MRRETAGAAFNDQNVDIEIRFQALQSFIANHHRKVDEAPQCYPATHCHLSET